MRLIQPLKLIAVSMLCVYLIGCSAENTWLAPSRQAIGVPQNSNLPFEDYVQDSRQIIEKVITKQRFSNAQSPYVGGYSVADVVNMRAPFQIPLDSDVLCQQKKAGAGKGFLLIHGLTDSPYLLKNIAQSLANQYPCALIRAVLLPGHGTVVGDTLAMKYQDWIAITEYGVRSFDKIEGVQELFLVGFSTGTALAIKHLKTAVDTQKIKGLILLSTAVKARSDFAWLSQYVIFFKRWLEVREERDAARYSSFSVNAAVQFYQLTKDIMSQQYAVNVPVLMAVSADDATISSGAAREFFCKYVHNERKLLLWFNGFSAKSNLNCTGIYEIEQVDVEQRYEDTDYKYANLSHTGVAGDPGDNHYGVNGVYRDCKSYEAKDDQLWRACLSDHGVKIFAEKNIKNMPAVLGKTGMWRRGTFNKDYQKLLQSILCLTDKHCDLKVI